MKNFKSLFFLSFVFILFSSCTSSKGAKKGEDITNDIKGKWEIYYEICCGRNSKTTFGGNTSINFNTKKSTYTYTNDNNDVRKGKYEIQVHQEMGDMIILDDNFPAIIRIEEGKLYIDRGYMDLKTEVFQR